MKTYFATAALLALMTAPAAAQRADVTADLNMRAGPGTRYPVITTVPEGRGVQVYGCVSDYDWCDVSYGNRRGWVYADYLEYNWQNRRRPVAEWGTRVDIPVLDFVFGTYADRHYRGEPWYRDRDRWDRGDRRDRWDNDDRRRGDWRGDDNRRGDWRDRDRDRRSDWRGDDDRRGSDDDRRRSARDGDDTRRGDWRDRNDGRGGWRDGDDNRGSNVTTPARRFDGQDM